ncbi:MAG: HAD-IC family P-type ATPase [Patescibacteria group bacterium]|nr:HAD-IC family P-type ATPase [Patescibacteria group bacterium]
MTKTKWYKLSSDQALKKLDSSGHGLSQEEVKNRKKEFGKNELPKEKQMPWLKLFFSQFKSSLVYILLAATVVSFFLGDYMDGYVILAAVIINVIIGFFQERKAQNALKKLKEVITLKTLVFRNGQESEINVEDLVPGDVLVLYAGDKIPADARIISAKNLKVNEASLTGEAYPIEKFSHKISKETSLPDRQNMLYMGTVLAEGSARAVVTNIGDNTEFGKIAKLVKETEQNKTPLQVKLTRFSRRLAIIVLVVSALLLVIGLFTGREFIEMFTTSVAVAVSAIPEGLLIAVTLILTIGMQRILKHKSLVRNLLSAETLGSTTVICTDKTGTLTEGIMHVSQIITNKHDFSTEDPQTAINKDSAESFIFALKIGMLCNDAFIENEEDDLKKWKIAGGNPTERALLNAGIKLGLRKSELEKEYKRIDEIPFNSTIKYMATLHHYSKEQNIIFVKGAPEKILEMSNYIDSDGQRIKMTGPKQKELKKKFEKLSNKGLRILAFGYKRLGGQIRSLEEFEKEEDKAIIFVGFMALKDPLRKEAKETLKLVEQAGIKSVMITGDHKLTAQSIAQELGLPAENENIIEGKELQRLSDYELKKKVKEISVYARVSPEDKLRIVDAWQANDEVVAMTGDGVNDAPALKSANIGIALGSGTDVAKGAAGLVLMDDNFKTIEKAVEQGRVIFDNIKKVVLYLLSDGFSEILLITGSFILGYPLPLLAAQILWINLIDDTFPSLAMAMEPADKEIMKKKPEGLISSVLNTEMKVMIAIISVLSAIASFIIFVYFYETTGNLTLARTIAFTNLAFDSLPLAFSIRSLRRSILKMNPFKNKALVAAVIFCLFLQLAAVYVPFLQRVLRTESLGLIHWGVIVLTTLIEIIIIEITKHFFASKKRKN